MKRYWNELGPALTGILSSVMVFLTGLIITAVNAPLEMVDSLVFLSAVCGLVVGIATYFTLWDPV